MEKPKSCPFCGGDTAHVMTRPGGIDWAYVVWCRSCDCLGPPFNGEKEAVMAWNNREDKSS